MILLLSMKKQRVLYRSWPIFLLVCWYLNNCASLIVLRKNLYVKDLIAIVKENKVWRKIPGLCIGWKKWLSAPDSNQECLTGCITTIFSPGIIASWIWTDNATHQSWWTWIRNVTYCSATVSFHWPDTDVLSSLVHQKHVSCTNGIFLSIWYTRSTEGTKRQK